MKSDDFQTQQARPTLLEKLIRLNWHTKVTQRHHNELNTKGSSTFMTIVYFFQKPVDNWNISEMSFAFYKQEAENFSERFKTIIFAFFIFINNRRYSHSFMSPSQGGCVFPWSLNLFGFYPLFPTNKTPCSQKCFQLMFPWSRKFLRCSLDPQKCLLLFTIFFCLLYPSIHSRKNHFRTASFFSLQSTNSPGYMAMYEWKNFS